MSSPRPWSDSEGEVNTASRIEVRERDESANDLDQGDQQNHNTTNARHTETSGEGSAAVREWVPRWGQRQIPPWTSRTTGQRVAYCVGRRRNTRGANTFRSAHIAYKRKIERALERCRARKIAVGGIVPLGAKGSKSTSTGIVIKRRRLSTALKNFYCQKIYLPFFCINKLF